MAKPEHKHIYNSDRWQRLRLYKLRRDPLCEYCPSYSRKAATEVDHYIAIADGGSPWSMDNLRSTCGFCHKQKTARGERLHGCDEDGNPRDPRHWWNQ